MPRFLSEKNEVDLQLALTAIAVCPTLEDASTYLLEAHGLTVSPAKLEVHCGKEAERYGRVHEQITPRLEQKARWGNAYRAGIVYRKALEAIHEQLEGNTIEDPARLAVELHTRIIDPIMVMQSLIETRGLPAA